MYEGERNVAHTGMRWNTGIEINDTGKRNMNLDASEGFRNTEMWHKV
jgi:hypothetical protein